MYGTLTPTHTDGHLSFVADDGTHLALTIIQKTDQGTYQVRCQHGREWTLVDSEDRAELLEGWDD